MKEQDKQARGYNKRARGTAIDVGARVLIANKGVLGKRKLADKWSPNVYTVKDRNERTHTYRIENDEGDVRVVHRNLILDISFLPVGNRVNIGDESGDPSGDESEASLSGQDHSCSSDAGALDLSVSQDSQLEDGSVESDPESSAMSGGGAGVVGGLLPSPDGHGDEGSGSQQASSSLNVHAPSFVPRDLPSFGGEGCDIAKTLQEVSRPRRIRKPVHRLIESMEQVVVA